MLKEALQYIVGLSKAKVQQINGDQYSDKPLHRIDFYFPKADPLRISTLTGLMDYIRANIDEMTEKMIIEVTSPTMAKLYSQLDDNRDREHIIHVGAMLPELRFDVFVPQEKFCIGLQSNFLPTEDRELLFKFVGTVEAGTISQYSDDGVSQKATIKTGIASKGEAVIPNPVILKPYRTFLEVEQPESQFVFRMKEGPDGIMCGLFEADGGAWKMEAMQGIKEYLFTELENMYAASEEAEKLPEFIVIA